MKKFLIVTYDETDGLRNRIIMAENKEALLENSYFCYDGYELFYNFELVLNIVEL